MTDLVDAATIEEIVERPRHASTHIGRVISAEGKVYILHSQACLQYGTDLRECRYSKALDRGIDLADWKAWEDQPVSLCVVNGPSSLRWPGVQTSRAWLDAVMKPRRT